MIRKTVDRALERVLITLMMVMTLDVLWGVFTRYVLGSQASWTEELARFLLIWIGILGAAFASGRGMHLSIDLVSHRLSANSQKRLSNLIRLLIAAFALLVLVVGGLRLIYISQKLGQHSPALNIPMWMVYFVIPLSGLLILYYKLTERPSPH
ncbi:MAG: TRAP transporter small permease [Cyclobacteriaceae bacterium]|nr:TRAP transporter small permease [Cyclobacteriaceae bacterium]